MQNTDGPSYVIFFYIIYIFKKKPSISFIRTCEPNTKGIKIEGYLVLRTSLKG